MLYAEAGKHARRTLNQAFFTRLYMDADDAVPRVRRG